MDRKAEVRPWSVVWALLLMANCWACRNAPAANPAVEHTVIQPAVPQADARAEREVRATGKVRAVREYVKLTPKIAGQNSRLTLTTLVPSGAFVKKDDILAEFDSTQQTDAAREAKAKFEDFSHQVDQRAAENRSNAENRASEMSQASADLAKAEIQVRKGPILGEIQRLQGQAKMADANLHVASLKKSHAARQTADAAALRILELKRDRQKVALDRALANADRLVIKADIAGMVALENTFRSGSMGPPQEGDQMYPGQALLRIFDPSEMQVAAFVEEPDGAFLHPGAEARVLLDAYPDLAFPARLIHASPVAAAAVGSPIKRFAALFRIEKTDPRLLPDLAAAIVIKPPAKAQQ